MAHTATVSHGFSFKHAANAFIEFCARIAESNHRIQTLQNLSALSDEDLSKRGLKRDELVRHVFRDVYYL